MRLVLKAGDYEREFRHGGISWRQAAMMAVLDIRTWTPENKAKLTATP